MDSGSLARHALNVQRDSASPQRTATTESNSDSSSSNEVIVFHSQRERRAHLRSMLRGHFSVRETSTLEGLWRLTREASPTLVFVQLLMPKQRGVEILRLVHDRLVDGLIIAVSPINKPSYAVSAVKAGAFGFLGEDDDAEAVLSVAYEAIESGTEQRAPTLFSPPSASVARHDGKSRLMKDLRDEVKTIAKTDEHVAVFGESGTGKKTLARLLHGSSERPGIMRWVDGRELTEKPLRDLLQIAGPSPKQLNSEGVTIQNTLCILNSHYIPERDLLSDLELLAAPVMVRLADQSQARVRYRAIVVATQAHASQQTDVVEAAAALGRVPCRCFCLPPLRRRIEDLPTLWHELAAHCTLQWGEAPRVLCDDALEVLSTYSWPGNIIELKNLLERLTFLNIGPEIDATAIPMEFHIGGWRRGLSYRDAMDHMERQFFMRLLSRSGNCRRRVAERLGLSYSTLKFRLRKLQLNVVN